jgi:Ca2+-binding RTX toxin-like protein
VHFRGIPAGAFTLPGAFADWLFGLQQAGLSNLSPTGFSAGYAQVEGTGFTFDGTPVGGLFIRDPFLTGGTITKITFFSSGGRNGLDLTEVAITAEAFDRLFTGRPGHTADAADALAQTLLAGADRLTGSGNQDILFGYDGDDTVMGGKGSDQVSGGRGADTVYGGEGGDFVTGESGNDTLFGMADNDRLFGGGGADKLDGGAGSDNLTGGAGRDQFLFTVYDGTSDHADRVLDFRPRDDRLQLDNAVFTRLGPAGALDPDRFVRGAAAQDREDRLIWNRQDGSLSYDPDGTGRKDAVLVALFDQRTPGFRQLTAEMFDII